MSNIHAHDLGTDLCLSTVWEWGPLLWAWLPTLIWHFSDVITALDDLGMAFSITAGNLQPLFDQDTSCCPPFNKVQGQTFFQFYNNPQTWHIMSSNPAENLFYAFLTSELNYSNTNLSLNASEDCIYFWNDFRGSLWKKLSGSAPMITCSCSCTSVKACQMHNLL